MVRFDFAERINHVYPHRLRFSYFYFKTNTLGKNYNFRGKTKLNGTEGTRLPDRPRKASA